jgi:hypothetical protein
MALASVPARGRADAPVVGRCDAHGPGGQRTLYTKRGDLRPPLGRGMNVVTTDGRARTHALSVRRGRLSVARGGPRGAGRTRA